MDLGVRLPGFQALPVQSGDLGQGAPPSMLRLYISIIGSATELWSIFGVTEVMCMKAAYTQQVNTNTSSHTIYTDILKI